MDLNNKLRGLPHIYYLNLDERIDRKDYTETQYDKWKIKNYQRVSTSKYRLCNYEEWKDKVILNPHTDIYFKNKRHLIESAMTLSYLDLIKNWLETTDDKHFIIMEDDYDLSMIEYWHFDWEYLMNHIPYDWDVIQLGFENSDFIPCFLHPTLEQSGTGPLLLNRNYAEKIMRIHYSKSEDKFNLNQKINSYYWTKKYNNPSLIGDYIISKNGRSYSIPLIYMDSEIGSYEINYIRSHQKFLTHIKDIYNIWWKNLRDYYTLEDFFTYGKPNDKIIKVRIKN
jgi:hypothetical protein